MFKKIGKSFNVVVCSNPECTSKILVQMDGKCIECGKEYSNEDLRTFARNIYIEEATL